jgi:hypothetical protein
MGQNPSVFGENTKNHTRTYVIYSRAGYRGPPTSLVLGHFPKPTGQSSQKNGHRQTRNLNRQARQKLVGQALLRRPNRMGDAAASPYREILIPKSTGIQMGAE